MKDKDIIKKMEKETEKLCSLLCVDCEKTFEMEESEEGIKYFKISFKGDDLGYMIGNHGRHLDSLQYILQIIASKELGEEDQVRVLVDVGGYREEKNSKIEQMALQKADDVRILGEEIELEPMSPPDRRVVHMALSSFEDIATESVGEGRDRRVVIRPVK